LVLFYKKVPLTYLSLSPRELPRAGAIQPP
jgi:hypothetical protein